MNIILTVQKIPSEDKNPLYKAFSYVFILGHLRSSCTMKKKGITMFAKSLINIGHNHFLT